MRDETGGGFLRRAEQVLSGGDPQHARPPAELPHRVDGARERRRVVGDPVALHAEVAGIDFHRLDGGVERIVRPVRERVAEGDAELVQLGLHERRAVREGRQAFRRLKPHGEPFVAEEVLAVFEYLGQALAHVGEVRQRIVRHGRHALLALEDARDLGEGLQARDVGAAVRRPEGADVGAFLELVPGVCQHMVKRTLRAVRVHERLEVLRAFHQFAFRRRARVAHRRIVGPRNLVLDARPVVAARGEGRHDVEPLVDPRGVDAPDRRVHVGIAQEGAALRGRGRRVEGAGLDGPVARRRQALARTVHRHDERIRHANRPRGPTDAREDLALRHVAEDVEERTSPRHLLVTGLAHRLGKMRHFLVRIHMAPQNDGAQADLVAKGALHVELPRPGDLPEMVFAADAAT